jgi:hypothetical protein
LKAQGAEPNTIWHFFGIPQGMQKLHTSVFNRLGKMSKLEAKPPVLNIADPANLADGIEQLGAGGEAIQVAAKVKQAEDAAPQKIKAVRYLAKIGCGCYDEVGVTDAIVKAMGDATESVRLATIEAISDAAKDGECESCNEKSCCNKKIVEKLAERAYEIDETGCFVDRSEKVREAAIEALQICCPGVGSPEIVDPMREGEDRETPELADPPPPGEARVLPLQPKPAFGRRMPETENVGTRSLPIGRFSSRRGYQSQPSAAVSIPNSVTLTNLPQGRNLRIKKQQPVILQRMEGIVLRVDTAAGLVYLEFPELQTAGVGSKAEVFHKFLLGSELTGDLTIIRSSPGQAVARAELGTRRAHIARGDVAIGWGSDAEDED